MSVTLYTLLTSGPPSRGRCIRHCSFAAPRTAAFLRVQDHHLYAAHRAAGLVNPHRGPIVLDPPADSTLIVTIDPDRALSWFRAEHRVLLCVLRQAIDNGLDRHTYRLAWALTDFLQRQCHWSDQATAQQAPFWTSTPGCADRRRRRC